MFDWSKKAMPDDALFSAIVRHHRTSVVHKSQIQVKLAGIPVVIADRQTKDPDVSSFQRFDTDAAIPLTERDLKRRWAVFHKAIHDMSGKKWQRVLGQMLGVNTVRYKVARFFGRPLLIVVRKLRGSNHVREQASTLSVESTNFPHNFKLSSIPPLVETTLTEAQRDSVKVVVVDEGESSAVSIIESLNQLIKDTSVTWILLVDSSVVEQDQTTAVAALLAHVVDGDDVVFSDEYGPNPDLYQPIFKSPSVGPHTLLSYNVVGRPALLRVDTIRAVGEFSSDAGWAFEHDLYLRLSESGATFRHVAILLNAGRPAIQFSRTHIDDDSCRVVEMALRRRGLPGSVSPGQLGGSVAWTVTPPSPLPSIDIIIPTRDRVDLMRQCIDAVETKTTYPNYDIIILDNDSKEKATLDFFATTKYQVVPCPGVFNYARIVNRGVEHSQADYVVTLNNDTVLDTPDWLERMVGLASLPDVSFVGACLLDRDGRSEQESIVIAPYPQHLRTDTNYPHIDQFVSAIRDVAAVTGAVQMVRRELWRSLGGMDEELRVTMNDVDICLRSQLDGHYVVFTPDVLLYHHVSSSRGKLDPLEDRNRFIQRWDIFGTFRDPYFPESLQLLGETVYYQPR
jgi:GT2 family glycosyltransferase